MRTGQAAPRGGERITLLARPGCHLCDDARAVIERVAADLGVGWEERDITASPDDMKEYWDKITVTFVDGVQVDFSRVSEARAEVNGQAVEIPEATVARLPVYLRALYGLAERGISTVASEELAAAAGVNSAKLRKDLSHLGSYGIRGVGYDVDYLVYQVSRTLGLTQDWPVVIVGAGNLGRALANYGGFVSRGFTIAAMLDSDPAIVGR